MVEGSVRAAFFLAGVLVIVAISLVFVYFGPLATLQDLASWQRAAMFAVVAAVPIGLIAAAIAWPTGFTTAWTTVEKIANSGVFYFFAGLSLLLYAIHTTSSQIHPSLTFLLAMLGVAIMLFGTGSQAIGAIATAGAALPILDKKKFDTVLEEIKNKTLEIGSPTDDQRQEIVKVIDEAKTANPATENRSGEGNIWQPFKANAAVAGGAAVLTAIFGFGVISQRAEIKEVFGQYEKYTRIRINACAALTQTCGDETATNSPRLENFVLTDYSVQATLASGAPLFTIVAGNEIQILVFGEAFDQNEPISLIMNRKDKNNDVSLTTEIDKEVDIYLLPAEVKAVRAPKEAEKCRQYSSRRSVACALVRDAFLERGGRIETAVYSLNFFRSNVGNSFQ